MIDLLVTREKWNKEDRESQGKRKPNRTAKEEMKMSSRSKEIMRMPHTHNSWGGKHIMGKEKLWMKKLRQNNNTSNQ